MLNSKMMRWFWLSAPAIAWATLMNVNLATAAERTIGLESEASSTQLVVEPIAVREAVTAPDSLPSDLSPSEVAIDESRIVASSPIAQPTATPVLEASESASESALVPVSNSLMPDTVQTPVDFSADLTGSESSDPMAQVTSISQLADVQPTDWAFQALQSLVERYGCIAGYPDGTYRGNRALTRYEFAAGLNACLDRVNELIDSATSDLITREDLETLSRLQEEFAAELATLRGRVDALEARTAELEANQFSTTTTLRGLGIFNLSGAFTDESITAERNPFVPDVPFAPPVRGADNRPSRVERDEPNVVSNYLLWLNLTTSFTGSDQLVTQLAVGNGRAPVNEFVSSGFFNTWGAPFLETTPAPGGSADQVTIRELFYSFSPTDDLRVTVGPRINFYRHFDNNRFTFFITGATSFNSNGSTLSNAVDRGSGAVVAWTISPQLRLSVGYLGQNSEFLANNTANDPIEGLFGGTNTLSGEVVYSPTRNFNLRLLYTRSNIQAAANGFLSGEPIAGIADDGFGGAVEDATADTIILNFDWLITSGFGIFGRYAYGSTDIDPVNPARSGGELNVQSIQFGLAFPDLGKQGALGVFSFLVPNDYLDGREFLLSGNGDGATQYEFELSYFYPVTNNIAIIPTIYAIVNPNSFESNPTVFVGNLRTQFSF